MVINEEIKILIVDDNLGNLLVLEGILEELECNIIRAMSGNEALGLTLEHEFALVLLDVQMPEMDGFETAELMRGSERTKFIPIIFVTAISKDQRCIFKGYEVGAVDYLFKPIEAIVLKSKVKVFLELYKQKRMLKTQAEVLEAKVKELLELKETNFHLENLSTLDGLTGIPNRRSFDQFIEMSWKNSMREQQTLALVMADIDYFKAFNDNYGHLKGDDCLRLVAKTLVTSIKRPIDFVARYGGEEFIAVLPNTDKIGALLVAERMRRNIEHLAITHEHSMVASCVTISLGITDIIPQQADTILELIQTVDNALYQAKQLGRNRVFVASF
ncbi:diguanylate cyclase [Desulfosporosinus sp. Sb-LF]|uniref:diguanylate cyclase domain-containing protein n=1 Tax=Desulfosporosinus sp. Sb-LF TaxID=2560027 RepID=UPI0018EE828A|nr:diguanylate cyclase [Desulfosporosinus sp. Sb-LF]